MNHEIPQVVPARTRRFGFTLIEILMVLAIIGILIGLLLPVIINAINKGNLTKEAVEVHNVTTALQKFKDRYGVYPPSQIVLIENGDYSSATWQTLFSNTDAEVGVRPDAIFLRSISVQYLRRIFPQLLINDTATAGGVDSNGDGATNYTDYVDWNGDGNPTPLASVPHVFYLTGDECLAFFLGGIATGQYLDNSGNPQRPSGVAYDPKKYPPGTAGFSKFPGNPTLTAGRESPLWDFSSDRLMDRDNDGFYEVLPIRKPGPVAYAYFSAYEGAGYHPDDLNLDQANSSELTLSGAAVTTTNFGVLWPIGSMTAYPTPNRPSSAPYYNQSPAPNPYTIGLPYDTTTGWVPRFHKPDGFQIISPGTDKVFGHGGTFPLDANVDNSFDKDNLTNFSAGVLGDGQP